MGGADAASLVLFSDHDPVKGQMVKEAIIFSKTNPDSHKGHGWEKAAVGTLKRSKEVIPHQEGELGLIIQPGMFLSTRDIAPREARVKSGEQCQLRRGDSKILRMDGSHVA